MGAREMVRGLCGYAAAQQSSESTAPPVQAEDRAQLLTASRLRLASSPLRLPVVVG